MYIWNRFRTKSDAYYPKSCTGCSDIAWHRTLNTNIIRVETLSWLSYVLNSATSEPIRMWIGNKGRRALLSKYDDATQAQLLAQPATIDNSKEASKLHLTKQTQGRQQRMNPGTERKTTNKKATQNWLASKNKAKGTLLHLHVHRRKRDMMKSNMRGFIAWIPSKIPPVKPPKEIHIRLSPRCAMQDLPIDKTQFLIKVVPTR